MTAVFTAAVFPAFFRLSYCCLKERMDVLGFSLWNIAAQKPWGTYACPWLFVLLAYIRLRNFGVFFKNLYELFYLSSWLFGIQNSIGYIAIPF